MYAPDKGIPEEVLDHAKCIAVVPHMLKAGFVFGAENGKGVATCRTANGWSAPAFFDITGGSWGLQIGVEGVDLVLIIQDHGMNRLLSSHLNWSRRIRGSRSGWASCHRRYRLEAGYRDPDLLARQRPLCRHLAGRVCIRHDSDATEAIYGSDVSTSALLHGEIAAPVSTRSFLNAVRDAKAQSIASR